MLALTGSRAPLSLTAVVLAVNLARSPQARHVPFLWDMFGTNMKVEPMFNELFRDNQMLVNLVGDSELSKVIGFLTKGKKEADFLEFLSVLCECDGSPVVGHQTRIGEMLLGKSNPPVYLTRVNSKFDGVEVTLTGNWADCQPLNKFAESALDEDDSTSTPEYLFLQRQLELYGNLCLGRETAP